MSKSIETVWQHGFIDDMALVAPQVNNLYALKSQNLIDRFERMFVSNQRAVMIGAVVIFTTLTFIGAPVLGVLVGLMLGGLVAVGNYQLKALRKITKTQSSFDYLMAFDKWLMSAINQYVRLYRFFYPALFALCSLRLCYSNDAQTLLADWQLLGDSGHPSAVLFAAIAIVSIVLGIVGGRIYRADVTLVYGREIKKLKALIREMEILRS